jgi:hypothetical protein
LYEKPFLPAAILSAKLSFILDSSPQSSFIPSLLSRMKWLWPWDNVLLEYFSFEDFGSSICSFGAIPIKFIPV